MPVPSPITAAVLITWVIMAVLVWARFSYTQRLSRTPSATQEVCELIVGTVDSQIRDTMQVEPAPYRAFIGTLFGFIFVANWSALDPGRGTADRTSRNRRGAGPVGVSGGDLVRHPRRRSARFSRTFARPSRS